MEYHFDINELEDSVAKVLRYSQSFDDNNLDGIPIILKDWFNNKKFFIDHMDGRLIYQFDQPVSFELDESAKREKLEHFAEDVDSHYNNWPLRQFLDSLRIDDFYNNRTSIEYTIGVDEDIVIPKNFKVVKAFKFFEKNAEILKQLQSEASRIIQENVVSGYLCFSVHPLDYLSLSENVHNWRSCHALDGEYRSGNLNYMVDPTTVICYLRAEKQAVLPHFPEDVLWNSKKWRVLLFFSNDDTMVFAGRQYPFSAEHGIELIREQLLPTLKLGNWTKWNDTFITSSTDRRSNTSFYFQKMIPVGNTLKNFSSIVKDGPDTHHFNDLIRSSVYSPIWSYRKRVNYWDPEGTGCSDAHTEVVVGRYCSCPVCGLGVVAYTDSMACPSCANKYGFDDSDYYECEMCGSMTFCDDMYDLEYSGLRVCPDCYQRETVRCQECGIHDLPDTIKYHDGDSRCLCPGCWEDSQRANARPVRIEDISIQF